MDDQLQRAFEGIGCSEATPLRQQLDILEEVLANRHDHRRSDALLVLESLQQPAGQEVERLAGLRARYGPKKAPVDRVSRYRSLIHPNDKGWWGALDELAASPEDHLAVSAFSKAICNTFGGRLRNADTGSRSDFLNRHRDFFVSVIGRLEHRLPPHDLVELKNWLAESRLLRLADLLALADKERTAARWEEVREYASEIQRTVQNQQQGEKIGEALAASRSYTRWRKRFDELLRVVRGHKFRARPLFPWSPPEDLSATPVLTIEQLEDTLAGLETWGSNEDHRAWTEGLTSLSVAALHDFFNSGSKPAHEAIRCLEELRTQWLDTLGALPELVHWEAAEADLRARLDIQVGSLLADLRAAFTDHASFVHALRNQADLLAIGSLAETAVDQLRADVEKLDEIDRDVGSWWESGSGELLRGSRFQIRVEELEGLQTLWGASPGYISIDGRFQRLKEELQRLEAAERLMREGSLAEADEVLSKCSSPPALRLRREAQQASRDDRIRLAVRQGRLQEISPDDLKRASPDVKALYDQGVRGKAYLGTLRQAMGAVRRDGGLQVYAKRLFELRGKEAPAGILLSPTDQAELEHLRRSAYDQVIDGAAHEVTHLRSALSLYPVLDESTLSTLEQQTSAVQEVADLPEVHPVDANTLRQGIAPIVTALEVHRASTGGDWGAAESVLSGADVGSYLDHEQRRALMATLRSRQLLHARAADADWLAYYREFSDVVMRYPEPRMRYLRLLRGAEGVDHTADLPILTRWFPEEENLCSLLACLVDARRAEDIDDAPSPVDEVVFLRLLREFSQSPYNYFPVRKLWDLLSEELRTRLWPVGPSPVQRVADLLGQEHLRIEARLADPETGIGALRQDLTGLIKTGLVDARTVKMLDAAAALERRMRDFDRQDPWSASLRRELEEADRDLGYLTAKVRRARGWPDSIAARISGINAWADVETAWQIFRARFAGGSQEFHLDAEPWRDFAGTVRIWIGSIDQALPRLDWALPRAHESERWRDLLAQWRASQEGVLALESGQALPVDLGELRGSFVRVVEQIEAFAVLHASLLDEPTFDRLEELHRLQPLCAPVLKIRSQLTNPDVAYVVGKAYRQFLDARKTS